MMEDGTSPSVSSTSHHQGLKDSAVTQHEEAIHNEATDTAAEKGHLATDQ